MNRLFYSLCIIGTLFLAGNQVFAEVEVDKGIDIYYTESCPHCRDARAWLGTLVDIDIDYFLLTEDGVASQLKERLENKNEGQSFGIVPAIFVNNGISESLFIGFKDESTTGAEILNALQEDYTPSFSKTDACDESDACGISAPDVPALTTTIPFLGELDLAGYSMGLIAIALGFFDGFNVCSLGALALILTITISLGSRKKTFVYGGLFIVVTGVVYVALIYLWYMFFEFFSSWFGYLEYIIALAGIGGGVYFLKEFLRMRKNGITCDSAGLPIVGKITMWVQRVLKNKSGTVLVISAIVVFAAVLTIVEFPCSAAVPVMFAGMLAAAPLSGFAHIGYMALFMIFYLADEIIIFVIAAYSLNMWMMKSTKAIMWFALIQAIILLGLGFWYLL